MPLPNEKPPLCENCRKRPATERYWLAGEISRICVTCRDRWNLQDAFEHWFSHILHLERRQQYDEALTCLDKFLEENRSCDHDGWLANSVALSRTSILFDAGRYAEAELAYNAWAQFGFIDFWRQQMYALGLAKTLEALGRDREALPVLENVLGKEEPKDLVLALSVVRELVRLSEKVGQPFDRKWLRIAKAAAKDYGVDMPVKESLLQTIVSLEGTLRSTPPERLMELEIARSKKRSVRRPSTSHPPAGKKRAR